MDTTQKNRPEDRQPHPQEGREPPKKRPAQQVRPRRPEGSAGAPPRPRPQEERPAQNRKPRPEERPQDHPRKPQGEDRPRKTQDEDRPRKPREEERPRKPQGADRPRKGKPQGTKAPRKSAPKRRPLRRKAEPDDTLSAKPRAYGNSKPKKKSAAAALGGSVMDAIQRSAARAKRKKSGKDGHPQQPTPAVIYTEPKTFNRTRFAIQMATVAAVAVAMVMGLSLFFKVKTITVSGAEVYSAWAVREASGIQEGDNLLTFGNARAGALIKANLPYVKSVRLGIKLPDTVNIMIEEEDVVYAIQAKDGLWWLMTSDGRVVEMSMGGKNASYTQILGVTLEEPGRNQNAVASEFVPTETGEDGNVIPVAVTGAQRLKAALAILKALEDNDIVGAAASVDVSRIDNITLWYGNRYQVNLGDDTMLDYKIACMNDVILQMSDYQTGILDISFTIWPDRVGYTPFA